MTRAGDKRIAKPIILIRRHNSISLSPEVIDCVGKNTNNETAVHIYLRYIMTPEYYWLQTT